MCCFDGLRVIEDVYAEFYERMTVSIVSYGLVRPDEDRYLRFNFNTIVLDEAQVY